MNETEKHPKQMPSAFPLDGFDTGMTLRDYFANSAMQVVITKCIRLFTSDASEFDAYAKASYKIADAMLKQREL